MNSLGPRPIITVENESEYKYKYYFCSNVFVCLSVLEKVCMYIGTDENEDMELASCKDCLHCARAHDCIIYYDVIVL